MKSAALTAFNTCAEVQSNYWINSLEINFDSYVLRNLVELVNSVGVFFRSFR